MDEIKSWIQTHVHNIYCNLIDHATCVNPSKISLKKENSRDNARETPLKWAKTQNGVYNFSNEKHRHKNTEQSITIGHAVMIELSTKSSVEGFGILCHWILVLDFSWPPMYSAQMVIWTINLFTQLSFLRVFSFLFKQIKINALIIFVTSLWTVFADHFLQKNDIIFQNCIKSLNLLVESIGNAMPSIIFKLAPVGYHSIIFVSNNAHCTVAASFIDSNALNYTLT